MPLWGSVSHEFGIYCTRCVPLMEMKFARYGGNKRGDHMKVCGILAILSIVCACQEGGGGQGKQNMKMYTPQHISQPKGGKRDQKEEPCLLAAVEALPFRQSKVPCL